MTDIEPAEAGYSKNVYQDERDAWLADWTAPGERSATALGTFPTPLAANRAADDAIERHQHLIANEGYDWKDQPTQSTSA